MSKIIKVELTNKELERLNLLLTHNEATVEGYIPFLIFKEYLLHDFRSRLLKENLEDKSFSFLNSEALLRS